MYTNIFITVGLICLIYIMYKKRNMSVMEIQSVQDDLGSNVGANQTFQQFVDVAKVIDPKYPINIPWIGLPKITKLPTYLKYKERLLTPVVDQFGCASCWSITVTSMMSDRISIYTGGKVMRPLSIQEMISCWSGHRGEGCRIGGIPETAYKYVVKNGISLAKDYPYQQKDTNTIAECDKSKLNGLRTFLQSGSIRSLCRDPYQFKTGSTKYKQTISENIKNMKNELFYNGPFVGTIMVYQNLYDYKGTSIYTGNNNSRYIGGHAILIIGYSVGEMNGKEPGFDGDYWVCKNSWSMSWPSKSPASKGYFYIKMGDNVCGIESRASRALPVLTSEVKSNMVGSLSESRYETYGEYVEDPERENYIVGVSKLRGWFN